MLQIELDVDDDEKYTTNGVWHEDWVVNGFRPLMINISMAQIYMWIWSNALYIKYYTYLITYTRKNAEPAV